MEEVTGSFGDLSFAASNLMKDSRSDKKERRRKQLNAAQRRHRNKVKEEDRLIGERIATVYNQLQVLAQSPEEECTALVIFASDEELSATIAQKEEAIRQLHSENQRLAHQLRSAPSIGMFASTLASPMSTLSLNEPIREMPIDLDLTTSQDLATQAIQELVAFGLNRDVSTEFVYSRGWKIQVWPSNACMYAMGVQSCDLNVEQVVNTTWGLLTSSSLETFKRIFPAIGFVRVAQRLTDDLVIIQRLDSVPSDIRPREFISLAFRQRIEQSHIIGLKTLPSMVLQQDVDPQCVRGEELRGWIFSPNLNQLELDLPWIVRQVSAYDIKGAGSKQLWDGLANDAIANIHRWENEVIKSM